MIEQKIIRKIEIKISVYFETGKLLSEAGNHYGEGIIKKWLMLKFYELNKKVQTLSAQLSWSHYSELLIYI